LPPVGAGNTAAVNAGTGPYRTEPSMYIGVGTLILILLLVLLLT
jgi:hypothetical protein